MFIFYSLSVSNILVSKQWKLSWFMLLWGKNRQQTKRISKFTHQHHFQIGLIHFRHQIKILITVFVFIKDGQVLMEKKSILCFGSCGSQVFAVWPAALWFPWQQEWAWLCASWHCVIKDPRPATSSGLALTRSPVSKPWLQQVTWYSYLNSSAATKRHTTDLCLNK